MVNSILKPLINAIPIGDGVSGLITMLVPRNAEGAEIAMSLFQADPSAADLTKSVYIDWGAFIMAIITFLLTALVLFFILKAIASAQKGFGGLRKEGKSRKEIKAIMQARAEEAAAKAAAEAEANKPETTEELLKEIRDLLRAQAASGEKADDSVKAAVAAAEAAVEEKA